MTKCRLIARPPVRFVLALLVGLTAISATARTPRPGDLPQRVVTATELPAEARATLLLIKRGGPFPYRKDGVAFQNREHRLAARPPGYYREYTVHTPGARDRGARRIIAGRGVEADLGTSGEYYYTEDHYRTFRKIRE